MFATWHSSLRPPMPWLLIPQSSHVVAKLDHETFGSVGHVYMWPPEPPLPLSPNTKNTRSRWSSGDVLMGRQTAFPNVDGDFYSARECRCHRPSGAESTQGATLPRSFTANWTPSHMFTMATASLAQGHWCPRGPLPDWGDIFIFISLVHIFVVVNRN